MVFALNPTHAYKIRVKKFDKKNNLVADLGHNFNSKKLSFLCRKAKVF